MELILWQKKYMTGIEKLDNEHKEFSMIINKLHKAFEDCAESSAIKSTVYSLRDYMQDHIAEEEDMMLNSGYPDSAEHIKKHKEFAANLDTLINEAVYKYKEAPFDTIRFMAEWWLEHIMKEDKKLGKHLLGCKKINP